MKWIVRHTAWLIPRVKGNDAQSPLYSAMGSPYRGKLLEFGGSVLAHLPEVGKGTGNHTPKLADKLTSAVWLGKSDPTDEHLARRAVYALSARRIAEHSWSEEKPPRTTVDDIGHPSCN